MAEADRAMRDEPLSAWVVAMRSHLLGFMGRHAESVSEADRGLQLDPDSFFAHWNLMRAYAWDGQHTRAIAEAPILLTESGRHHWVLGALAWAYGQVGELTRAGGVHDELLGRSKHEFLSPTWLAVSAYAAGRHDEAFDHLARAVEQRDPLVVWSRKSPFHASSRTDERFDKVTRGVWDLR
jgi:tetratricopeptide (TPR) repeat protein